MLDFEWDHTKAAANLRSHCVTFDEATKAFQDAFAVEWIDTRFPYAEERMTLLGVCGNTMLYVAYTERSDNIRIISARRATKNEQAIYYRRNTP